MRATPRLTTTTAASALLIASSASLAQADITAEDVWTNMNAPVAAMGATISGTPARNSNIVTYNDIRYDFQLPLGIGAFGMTSPSIAMIENADGTVTVEYPEDFTMIVDGSITGEGSFNAEMEMVLPGASSTASGEPGDITYVATGGDMRIGLNSIVVDGTPMDNFEFLVAVDTEGAENTTRIVEGDLITMTGESATTSSTNEIRIVDPMGSITQGNGTATTSEIAFELALPAGGSDLLNLAPAFAQGLSLQIDMQNGGGSNTQSVTSDLGVVISNQTTSQGPSDGTISLDADGLVISGTGTDFVMELTQEFIPFPINLDIAQVEIGYAIPLSARDEPQDYAFNMALGGFRLGPDLWDLFDPSKQLTRGPADINIDLGGTAMLTTDVTNFLQLGAEIDAGGLPVMPETVQLRDFSIAALGGSANMTADFTLDWTDMFTYPGSPKPVGNAAFSVNGLNAVMEQLSNAGFISPDDMFGVNMMIGMVAQASGEDELTGTIELGENGEITANGQRLR